MNKEILEQIQIKKEERKKYFVALTFTAVKSNGTNENVHVKFAEAVVNVTTMHFQ